MHICCLSPEGRKGGCLVNGKLNEIWPNYHYFYYECIWYVQRVKN